MTRRLPAYDAVFINGKIFTSDRDNPYAEALAVKDGRIAWAGSMDQLEAHCGEGDIAQVIDLQGKRVLPGFVDSHMHAIMLADCCKQISVLPPCIYSIEDLIEAIRQVRSRQTDQERTGGGVSGGTDNGSAWIEGWGYDEGKLAERRAPTCRDLDAGCSDRPVMILRTCAHVCVVNSYVLAMAGITADTPDPQGGRIGRFADGTPNGILYENARDLVTCLKPPKTAEQLAADLCDLGRVLLSQGVTTASDMGEFMDCDYETVYPMAIQKGFPIRVAGYYMWDKVKDIPDFTLPEDGMDPGAQFHVAGIKLIGDGSVSGRTAWCDRPYLPQAEGEKTACEAAGASAASADAGECGMPVCTEDEIEAAIAFCKAHGCQLSIHTMGGRAIDRAIDHLWRQIPWMPEPVPSMRMEHVAMPSKEAIARAAAAGIGWITQPVFLYAEIESYLKNLGPAWTKETYPIRDMLEAGVNISFSTDAPATAWATPSDPFVCLQGAVTRRAWDGTDCGQAHRVDIETAIMLYTAASAPMLGFTDVGMLKKGYAADLIVLDRDILEMPVQEIGQVKVEATYIGGQLAYSASSETA